MQNTCFDTHLNDHFWLELLQPAVFVRIHTWEVHHDINDVVKRHKLQRLASYFINRTLAIRWTRLLKAAVYKIISKAARARVYNTFRETNK